MEEHFDCGGRNYGVILDSKSSDHGLEEMWFYQGDTGGTLTIFLYEGGKPMDLPPHGKVMCFFERKDKQIVQRELPLVTRGESKYVANVDASILEVAGKVKCEVKVYHCENRTTFTSFEFTAKKSMSIEGSPDTPEKLDLIQTVSRHGEHINDIGDELHRNHQDKVELGNLFNQHNNSILELYKLVNELDGKVGDNHKEVLHKIGEVEKSFNEVLIELAKNVNNRFDATDIRIQAFEEATGVKFAEVAAIFAEMGTAIDNNFTSVSAYLQYLQLNKVTIITSEEKPDTTNLPLGTLWIKPQPQEEVPEEG